MYVRVLWVTILIVLVVSTLLSLQTFLASVKCESLEGPIFTLRYTQKSDYMEWQLFS